MLIKVSTLLQWPISRQIFRANFNDIQFTINQPVKTCDAWIVYQGLFRPETTHCPPENVILFTYEPPGLHDYPQAFLNQFAKIVTCHRSIQHPGVIYRHQAQPWLAGLYRDGQHNIHRSDQVRFTVDDFAAMAPPAKPRLLSVLCSNKVVTEGHRHRLAFVGQLRQALGDAVDVYGYGFQPLTDKWDALAPYKYHIVLENSIVEDYWTEKLADAYLGYCFPIVSGCPNLERYFSQDAYLSIDIHQPDAAIAKIRTLLTEDPYQQKLPYLQQARRQILYEYNLFAEIIKLVQIRPASAPQKITLKDERLFLPGGWLKPWIRPLKDWWTSPHLKLASR
ncbi:MAG: glycosyltransferase family 10 domain-containing protein [Nodosilinea sp.]